MEYSDNVFFLPWEGGKYEEGIIPSGENIPGDLKPLKLMALGKEHYCLDENHCKNKNHEQDYYLNSLKILAPLQTDPTKIKDKIVAYYQVRKEIKEKIEQDKEFSAYFNTEIWESSFRKDIKYWDKIYIVYKWLEFYKKNFPDEYNQASKHLKEKGLSWLENHNELGAIEKILRVHSLDRMDNDPQKDLRPEDLEEDAKKVQEILRHKRDFEDNAAQHPQCHMHELYECSLCKNEHPCSHCFQMPICRYMTCRELYGYINDGDTKYPSPREFRKSLDKNSTSKIWNQLVFSNFYQQSMPNTQNNAPGDNKRAMQAFVEIVKQYKPDIIITWGNDPFDVILQDRDKVLDNEKISLRKLNNLPPRLQIKMDSKAVPFAVLTGYDQDHPQKSCLLVSTVYHPSARYYFKPAAFNKCLGEIWEHYEELKKS